MRALRAELRARERVQRAAQVGHRQAPVHRESLDLVEHRGVGGVEFVGAEGAADRDDVDRQVALEQRADLHRRGVGAQHLARAVRRDVEGVLLAARRVVGREVQRVEVELLGLDLGALGQFPAHRDEGVGDVLGQDGDRVPGADAADGSTAASRRCARRPARRRRARRAAPPAARRSCAGPRPRATLTRLPASARSALGSVAQRLAGQRQRRAVAEVLGLGAGEIVEVAGQIEGVPGRTDRFGQLRLGDTHTVGHIDTITHAVRASSNGCGTAVTQVPIISDRKPAASRAFPRDRTRRAIPSRGGEAADRRRCLGRRGTAGAAHS